MATLSRKRERVGPAAKPWEGEGSYSAAETCLTSRLSEPAGVAIP